MKMNRVEMQDEEWHNTLEKACRDRLSAELKLDTRNKVKQGLPTENQHGVHPQTAQSMWNRSIHHLQYCILHIMAQ
jgi:hypothetical protein